MTMANDCVGEGPVGSRRLRLGMIGGGQGASSAASTASRPGAKPRRLRPSSTLRASRRPKAAVRVATMRARR